MIDLKTTKARVFAYYLPQFHPIPENDSWWGKGFTEWRNVATAIPLFKGHKQPRIPTDLGFYDLRIPEIRVEQARLAKDAGIEGFIYWNYYFGNGKRLLQMPINEVLKTRSPDFPFCFGWANHSWMSKSWDNIKSLSKNELLIKQEYLGESDNTNHFHLLLPAFIDKRYIRIDEKPVFLIYDPFDVPKIESFIELWNTLAIKNGLQGIYFIARNNGWSANIDKLFKFGFDSVNRNGQWEAECKIKGKIKRSILFKINDSLNRTILDTYEYSDIIKHFYNEYDSLEKVIPTIIPQWDRSPRSGKRGVIYKNCNPEEFANQVQNALQIIEQKKETAKLLILKSWNEWGEGNYMEPDKHYGHAFLDALRMKIVN